MSEVVLYLHGFMSTPLSYKAQLLDAALRGKGADCRYCCPQLPMSPMEAIQIAMDAVKDVPSESLTVIGSSLGGYYANWIAEQRHCRGILLNPVIDPWRIKILEDSPNRSDLQVKAWLDFREGYQTELEAIRVPVITSPERYMLIAAKGDELLDWHLMQEHYQGADQTILDGCNHGISDFDRYIPQVLAFCGLA